MASRTRSGEAGSPAEAPLPPGPDGYPLVGNAVQFLRDPFAFYDTLAEYGDVVRWRLPGFPYTSVLHPDGVEQVLVEDHDRFERNVLRDFDLDFAPEGLFLVDRDRWRDQRRVLQSAFTMDQVASYADAMVRTAERTFDGFADGEEIDLVDEFSDLTLRILARTLFDVDIDRGTAGATIARATRAINDRTDIRNLTTFLPPWVPTPANRRYERAMADYREAVDALVAERRDDPTGDDLLSTMLTAEGPDGERLSETEVRDNLLTFLFAGHETTSLALAFTVLLLAQDDAVTDRVREEVRTVVGNGTPGFEHVAGLTVTENAVRESLRLHPPAQLVTRRATEDVVVGGYRVPEGTIVSLPQFHVHTDGRFYDAPGAFRPDRWTDGLEDELPDYAYFPFGGGPRHCIGMRFAMLELRLLVALFVDTFEFELLSDPDPDIAATATRHPKSPVRVRVFER